MTLAVADIEAIADRVAARLSTPTPAVLDLGGAMKLCGFGSAAGFSRWAKRMGVRSMHGAKGRYSIAVLRAAIDRASRRAGRAAR